MNKDSSRETGAQTFAKFETGSSFALVITAVVLNLVSLLLHRMRRTDTARRTRPATQPAAAATTSDTELSDVATSGTDSAA
jgi:hypothetical protein